MTDAPVDGAVALDIEVAAAEPLRVGDGSGPRLRVAPPAPITAPRAPFAATVIGVVIVGVLGILLINTKTNENSFEIADLRKQGAALDNQQQDLENQLVAASSIGNLDAAARRLGLVKAENPALFRLPDGKIIGVPTPTNGRPAVTAQDAKTANGRSGADAANSGQANGTAADGTTANGTAANGTAANGTAANGTAANGTAANGTAANGTAANGTAANGTAANGTAGNGTAANGTAANGTAGNGTATDGTAANGGTATGGQTGSGQ